MHWTKPECTGRAPGPRRAHSAVLLGKHIVVFGGGDGSKALNETYTLDTEKLEWDVMKVNGQVPAPRGYHSATLLDDKMYIFGGSDGQECFSDCYVMDTGSGTWWKKKLQNPVPCWSHSATQVGNWLFVFGGNNAKTNLNELKLLNLDDRSESIQWITTPCTGTPPSPRGYHTSIFHDSRLFIFGGYDGNKCFNDVSLLDLGTYSYVAQKK